MGKRKMHGYTFYQCDWTGYPMRATNCYLPVWVNEKMSKRGSYCNWESVLAHAYHLYGDYCNDASQFMDPSQLMKVKKYVHDLTGMELPEEPDLKGHFPDLKGFRFQNLEHFKTHDTPGLLGSDWDMAMYHKVCCAVTAKFMITVVGIEAAGTIYESEIESKKGGYDFGKLIPSPADTSGGLQSFTCTHKPKMSKEREIVVYYWPFKNGLMQNRIASDLFKMKIYGDVLVVQKTKEACFKERQRYVHFTMQNYEEYFNKKKKKPVEMPALSTADFRVAREGMVASLSEFEQRACVGAERPGDLVKGAVMPPSSGKELMEVAEHRGLGPPVLCRQPTLKRKLELGDAQEGDLASE